MSRSDGELVHHRFQNDTYNLETNIWRVALSLTYSSVPFARSRSCLQSLGKSSVSVSSPTPNDERFNSGIFTRMHIDS